MAQRRAARNGSPAFQTLQMDVPSLSTLVRSATLRGHVQKLRKLAQRGRRPCGRLPLKVTQSLLRRYSRNGTVKIPLEKLTLRLTRPRFGGGQCKARSPRRAIRSRTSWLAPSQPQLHRRLRLSIDTKITSTTSSQSPRLPSCRRRTCRILTQKC